MNDPIYAHASTPGWVMLEDLELPVEKLSAEIIHAWLTNILAPLNLSEDFFARVLQSVQESALHELQQHASSASVHIHLSIFTPYGQSASQKTWGFFHTERSENGTGSQSAHVHRINYYLYVEGE